MEGRGEACKVAKGEGRKGKMVRGGEGVVWREWWEGRGGKGGGGRCGGERERGVRRGRERG